MDFLDLPIETRLEYMGQIIGTNGTISRWIYSSKGDLLSTDCRYQHILNRIFEYSGGLEHSIAHAEENSLPLVMSVPSGMVWCASFERVMSENYIHVLGPILSSPISLDQVNQKTQGSSMSIRYRSIFLEAISNIPVIPVSQFFRYALMFHYCVTGERLQISDIVFQKRDKDISDDRFEPSEPKADRMQTYKTEQNLLRMIREGNLDYHQALDRAVNVSKGVNIQISDDLSKTKVSMVAFITLCVRSSIEGGINPAIAYDRGDSYIQEVMDSRTVTDAMSISHRMYRDFIEMVHKKKLDPGYSKQVQAVCDYIQVHVDEKIELADIAKRVGYVDYYLSRKFKEETGTSINEFIRNTKIEKAKGLLELTDMSIQDISDMLSFNSRAFFANSFKKVTGIPPAEYRGMMQKL